MIHWPDVINGFFECGGGILLFMNVARLHRDKQIKGVAIIPTSFFMLWGYWNMVFYPAYHAWLSFAGGIVITAANTIWIGQMIYYSRIGKKGT